MRNYSFLNEFVMTTLAATSLGLGAYSTIKNARQNSFTKRYMNLLFDELNECDPNNRQEAIQVINKYCSQLTSIYNNLDKGKSKKLMNAQSFINTQFRTPLLQIVTNPNDPNWKQNCIQYARKNIRKINLKNILGTTTAAVSIGAGGALLGGVGGTVAQGVMFGMYGFRTAVNQIKVFNSTRYINKMYNEINAVPDNDRQAAAQIVNKYCYDISNTIQSLVNKTGKKINFDVQLQMRSQFMTPMLQIINNTNNKYWKISLLDFIKEQKCQQIIQHICNTAVQLIVPRAIRNFRGGGTIAGQEVANNATKVITK